ncbi:hypothetical protein BLA29_008218 [Euroglyphus maynei]|uniref:Uncharacterized protein n=1 Tax=Euroglyphus maynei TaxID=6958 RepID=A0A1Y3BMP4_EURMA|nr:hypothetical protein BLA29_008218 [Euroglyphus maynei]
MDISKMITRDNPYDRAGLYQFIHSFISKKFLTSFFFITIITINNSWIIPLFNVGYRKELEVNDLWKNPKVDSSERLDLYMYAPLSSLILRTND